jgi:hypothetical protein
MMRIPKRVALKPNEVCKLLLHRRPLFQCFRTFAILLLVKTNPFFDIPVSDSVAFSLVYKSIFAQEEFYSIEYKITAQVEENFEWAIV